MTEPEPKLTPEPENTQIIESVPLTTLIGVVEKQVTRLSAFYKSPRELIQAEMSETPRLGLSVIHEMKEALTPDEAKLIGETALIVHHVVRATPPPIEEFVVEGRRVLRQEEKDGSMVMGIEEDISEQIEGDKNAIYNLLMEEMARRPALAAFVAERMKQSVSLEEANLIGEAALATYMTMDYILSLPVQ